MKFTVIIRTPERQGFLGPVRETYKVEEIEAEHIKDALNKFQVPLDGEAFVFKAEDVTIVTSKIINQLKG